MTTLAQSFGRSASLATSVAVACAAVCLGTGTPRAQQQGIPQQLLGTLHVTDNKGKLLTDLEPGELHVQENGHTLAIQSAALDTRPLAVALVLDNNSELSTSFMQSVVPAGIAVVKALPPETSIDIWTTGDRPTQVGKALTDPAAAEAALRGIPAIGTNTLLHTIAQASKALPTDDTHRTAVVIITSGTLGDPGGYGYEQALKVTSLRPTFVSLEFVYHQADARVENELEFLARHSGGYFDKVFAITAFEKRAPALVGLLNAQYRIAWQPTANPRDARIEFTCSRKGAKVVAAQRVSAVW